MMRLNNGGRLFALALGLALALVATPACRKEGGAGGGNCAAQREKKDRKLVVGFSQMENNGPWRVAETASMKDEAAKRADRFEILVTDAQGNVAKQVNDVEDLVSRCVDAIFLAPREATGFEPALQAAKSAGIPVILIDREVKGTAGEDFLTFIGSDFVAEGRRAGEWLAKQTNGKAGIIELLGTAGSSVADDRHNGFMEAIRAHPDMKVLASQTGNFTRAEGQRVMENLIQAHQKNITAVYAHNDEMALGAIQALKAAGRKPGQDVTVVSVDGERAALEAIQAGELGATVESNPRFGPLAFETIEEFRANQQVPPKILLTDRLFDKTNAAQFVGEAY